MNFKKILLGSAIFAAGFGIMACGDDSSSGSDENGSSEEVQKADPIELPKASEASPIEFVNLTGTTMSGENDTQELSVSGGINLDFFFEDEKVEYGGDAEMLIDSVNFIVGWNDAGVVRQTKVTIDDSDLNLPQEKIIFSQKKFSYTQLDTNYGDYRLYLVVYSHTSQDGLPTTIYTSIDSSITFTYERPVEIASSAAAACVEMEPTILSLSNETAVSAKTLNFASGGESPADITLQFEDGVPQLKAGEGVELWETDYGTGLESGILPSAPVCTSIFKTAAGSKQSLIEEVLDGSWYIAKVKNVEYPFMVSKIRKLDGKGSLTITFYKKK